ncbi:hypothetical protein JOD20_005213 [Herpetosiphon giganteus]|nr:hypothetical protein [Herpetosiphon giganteus]
MPPVMRKFGSGGGRSLDAAALPNTGYRWTARGSRMFVNHGLGVGVNARENDANDTEHRVKERETGRHDTPALAQHDSSVTRV